MTVDHMEKRRRARNDHWPWVVNVFTPRHENFPIFRQAAINEGSTTTIPVSMIAVSHMREVHAKGKKKSATSESGAVSVDPADKRKRPSLTMILEATAPETPFHTEEQLGSTLNATAEDVVASGTRSSVVLLEGVSASNSRPGDIVRARLVQPVLANSHVVLPAGSLIEGKVVKRTPPRWLSRPGALYLTFTSVTLPRGTAVPIAATVAGAQLDDRSHTRIDPEGGLHGERPGRAWMAINIGVTSGIAKEVDDGVQLVIEAIVSTATDASTAGTARIVATCASTIYMATRHGRDVVLPRFTELDLTFDRPVSLPPDAIHPASGVGGGHAAAGQ